MKTREDERRMGSAEWEIRAARIRGVSGDDEDAARVRLGRYS